MRNSIHGEAMQPLAVGGPTRRDRTLASLPAAEEAALRAAVDALGGRSCGDSSRRYPSGSISIRAC